MADNYDFGQNQNQTGSNINWNWIAKNVVPLLAIASGNGNVMAGVMQGMQNAEEQRRQKNLDDWNKLIQNEQLKRMQRENATIDLTPENAEKFKGTMYEPWVWNPEKTKTEDTANYVSQMGIVNPGGTNMSGTTTINIPKTLKETSMNQNDYFNWSKDVENQNAQKTALEQKNKAYQDFINSIPDNNKVKPILTAAYNSGNTAVLDKAIESMIPKPDQGMTPYQKGMLDVAWFNATKNENQTKKDPLLMSYAELYKYKVNKSGLPNEKEIESLAGQYSLAIRNNINDPKKVQPYIDRYNYLTGAGFNYDMWKNQAAQKQYNPTNNKPIQNLAGENNNNDNNQITKKNNNKDNNQIRLWLPWFLRLLQGNNNKDNNQMSQNKPKITPQQAMNDARLLVSQNGGVDKAIQLLKRQGAKDSDPLMVALKQIKLKG